MADTKNEVKKNLNLPLPEDFYNEIEQEAKENMLTPTGLGRILLREALDARKLAKNVSAPPVTDAP